MTHPFAAHRASKVEHSRVAHITKGYATGGIVSQKPQGGAPTRKAVAQLDAQAVYGNPAKERADRRARGGKVKRDDGGRLKPVDMPTTSPRAQTVPMSTTSPRAQTAPMTASGSSQYTKPFYDDDGNPINRARGGRTRNKHTTVNIVMPHTPQAAPSPMPVGGGAGVAPTPQPVPRPMPGPMAGPGGPMPMPMGPRSDGGRAYARGGSVKSGPAFDSSRRLGTQVQHSNNKLDGANVGRGKQITFATGGAIYASQKKQPQPHLPGGSGGGLARLKKAHLAKKGAY